MRRALSRVGAVACSHCSGWLGSAGWSFSARARRRVVVARRVRRPLPGVARSSRALTVSLAQLSCRRYQPRGVCRALPWRVARRSSGSQMVVGVRRGFSGSWGAWRGGLPGSCASTSMYGWPWAGLAGLGGAGWPRGRVVGTRVPWVLVVGKSCGWARRPSGVLWWCLGGLQTKMGGVCGARGRLVDFWVMHSTVMDATLHVFPGSGVGELFRVCQHELFAVYHFGRCSADCF